MNNDSINNNSSAFLPYVPIPRDTPPPRSPTPSIVEKTIYHNINGKLNIKEDDRLTAVFLTTNTHPQDHPAAVKLVAPIPIKLSHSDGTINIEYLLDHLERKTAAGGIIRDKEWENLHAYLEKPPIKLPSMNSRQEVMANTAINQRLNALLNTLSKDMNTGKAKAEIIHKLTGFAKNYSEQIALRGSQYDTDPNVIFHGPPKILPQRKTSVSAQKTVLGFTPSPQSQVRQSSSSQSGVGRAMSPLNLNVIPEKEPDDFSSHSHSSSSTFGPESREVSIKSKVSLTENQLIELKKIHEKIQETANAIHAKTYMVASSDDAVNLQNEITQLFSRVKNLLPSDIRPEDKKALEDAEKKFHALNDLYSQALNRDEYIEDLHEIVNIDLSNACQKLDTHQKFGFNHYLKKE